MAVQVAFDETHIRRIGFWVGHRNQPENATRLDHDAVVNVRNQASKSKAKIVENPKVL